MPIERLGFVCDLRSTIARNWIKWCAERFASVQVISSYPADGFEVPGVEVHNLPMGLGRLSQQPDASPAGAGRLASLKGMLRGGARQLAMTGPFQKAMAFRAYNHLAKSVDQDRRKLWDLASELDLDLLHAMRLPLEGIIAGPVAKSLGVASVASIWGNDITLFAMGSRSLYFLSKQALHCYDGIHVDALRDKYLIKQMAPGASDNFLDIPGCGGLDKSIFRPRQDTDQIRRQFQIPADGEVVINARGLRPLYIRMDEYLRALPLVLQRHPNTVFLILGLAGNSAYQKKIAKLGLDAKVRLLPAVSQEDLSRLFSLSDIFASPSIHDGTPNSLLEAMACGCFPMAGGIASIREWISDGVNGLLCDARDPRDIARALSAALDNPGLRSRARELNFALMERRADYERNMNAVLDFYQRTWRAHQAA